jgi:hypothetical protein
MWTKAKWKNNIKYRRCEDIRGKRTRVAIDEISGSYKTPCDSLIV